MRLVLVRILNAALYFLGLGLLLSGTVLHATLPRGSVRRGLTWLGWDRHAWGDLHDQLAYFFVVGVVLHLGLHWTWVRSCFAGLGRWSAVLPLILVGAAASAVLLPLLFR